MAHIVTIHRRLLPGLQKLLRLLPGCGKLHRKDGILKLRLAALLHLIVIKGDKAQIEKRHGCRKELIDHPNPLIKGIGVNGSRIIEEIVSQRQPSEQPQRLLGIGHGRIGSRGKILPEKKIKKDKENHVSQLKGQLLPENRQKQRPHPTGQLTAEIRRQDADQRDPCRSLHRPRQRQPEGKMRKKGIELLGFLQTQNLPADRLQEQNKAVEDKKHRPIPLTMKPAGKPNGQKHPVKQHQPVIGKAQKLRKGHGVSSFSAKR